LTLTYICLDYLLYQQILIMSTTFIDYDYSQESWNGKTEWKSAWLKENLYFFQSNFFFIMASNIFQFEMIFHSLSYEKVDNPSMATILFRLKLLCLSRLVQYYRKRFFFLTEEKGQPIAKKMGRWICVCLDVCGHIKSLLKPELFIN